MKTIGSVCSKYRINKVSNFDTQERFRIAKQAIKIDKFATGIFAALAVTGMALCLCGLVGALAFSPALIAVAVISVVAASGGIYHGYWAHKRAKIVAEPSPTFARTTPSLLRQKTPSPKMS